MEKLEAVQDRELPMTVIKRQLTSLEEEVNSLSEYLEYFLAPIKLDGKPALVRETSSMYISDSKDALEKIENIRDSVGLLRSRIMMRI